MVKRIISAIVLILVLVPLCIAGKRPFSIAVGVIALVALKELIDLKKSHSKIPNGITLFSMCALLFLIFYEFEVHHFEISYTVLAVLSIMLLFPTLLPSKKEEYETKDAFYLIGVILFLGVSFHSVIAFRNTNIYLLFYLVMVPILTDTFAFLVGKYFGKRKIAPTISPKKTVAGTIGGSILGTIIPVIFYIHFIGDKGIALYIVTFILSLVGQLGDLLFSKIKRENGIKDFSDLIPGHGGILDRFDSTIFVILAYIILGKFL